MSRNRLVLAVGVTRMCSVWDPELCVVLLRKLYRLLLITPAMLPMLLYTMSNNGAWRLK